MQYIEETSLAALTILVNNALAGDPSLSLIGGITTYETQERTGPDDSFETTVHYVQAVGVPNGIFLASSVQVDTGITTKQELYTVPVGKRFVPMWVVARDVAQSMAAGDEILFGFDTPPVNWHPFSDISGLSSDARYIAHPGGGSTGVSSVGLAGEVFGCQFQDGLIPGSMVFDTFGYFI